MTISTWRKDAALARLEVDVAPAREIDLDAQDRRWNQRGSGVHQAGDHYSVLLHRRRRGLDEAVDARTFTEEHLTLRKEVANRSLHADVRAAEAGHVSDTAHGRRYLGVGCKSNGVRPE